MNKLMTAAAAFCVGLGAASAGQTVERPNINAALRPAAKGAIPVTAARERRYAAQIVGKPASRYGYRSEHDDSLGATTFLWSSEGKTPIAVGALTPKALAEARARGYLARQAGALKLSRPMIDSARVFDVHDTGRGAQIVRMRQQVAGYEVFQRDLSVMLDRNGALVATSGYFAPDSFAADGLSPRFTVTAAQAIAAAFADFGGTAAAGAFNVRRSAAGYDWYSRPATAAGAMGLSRDPRVKPVLFPMPDRLVPGWYVELIGGRNGAGDRGEAFVMSAEDGSLLFRSNLIANEAYSYRVFADADGIRQPFDAPIGNDYAPFTGANPNVVRPRVSAATNLVTLDSGPISTGDPWLPAGATTTTGNNVDAYLDTGLILGANNTAIVTDGFQPNSGDLRVGLSAANTFDYAITADANPQDLTVRNASIVNLFYINNWLHDLFYDRGFNEAAGNAQTSNLGRGGVEGDPILAEGQDASGRNNANMLTPSDGGSPRMQMYLFDGSIAGEVAVTDPSTGFSPFVFTTASFGPAEFDITGTVAVANEGQGVSSTDGCGAAPALPVTGTTLPANPDFNLRGRIAFIDRGNCSFTTKAQFAGASGALAMVVVQNTDDNPITMGNADVPQLPVNIPISTDNLYRTPSVMIRRDDAARVRDLITAGTPVTMHVQRLPTRDFDGTLDNQIIAHEFFHYVSNRLVGNGSGLSNTQGRGMGEGWSDFAALLLTVRPEDLGVPGNGSFGGIYPLAYYATPAFNAAYQYFGIRRQPYSRNPNVFSLTFQHIQDGTPLPTTAPSAFGQDGATNSEVHNTGEVWANMLFECYTNILDSGRYSFVDARRVMSDYLIAGLKMTPNAPTILEARDGVLAAALAANRDDFMACARGFAKRGAGVDAVAPPRNSTDNVGVTESNVALISTLTLTAAQMSVDATTDCDADGVLDGGESATLRLTIRNDGTYQDRGPIPARVTSNLPGVTFANDGAISFPATAVGDSNTATISVSLAAGAPTGAELPIALVFDPVSGGDTAVRQPPMQATSLFVNFDLARNQRTVDDLEQAGASGLDWTQTGSGGGYRFGSLSAAPTSGRVWQGNDPATISDFSLVTPLFTVPAGGTVQWSFDHFYAFEPSTTTGLLPSQRVTRGNDGGVLEVSVDGGGYVDAITFGGQITQGGGYNGQLLALDPAGSRRGFVGTNNALETVIVDFGTRLAGRSVRLRFRTATNASVGGAGWSIDRISITGATTPVFSSVIAENGVCVGGGTTTGGTTGGTTSGGTTGGGTTTGGTTTGGTTGGTTTGGTTTGGSGGGGSTGGTTGGTTGGGSTGSSTGGSTGGTTGSTTGGATTGTTGGPTGGGGGGSAGFGLLLLAFAGVARRVRRSTRSA